MAADVDAEDAEERGERRDLRVPEMEIGGGAMEEGDPGLALGPLDQDACSRLPPTGMKRSSAMASPLSNGFKA